MQKLIPDTPQAVAVFHEFLDSKIHITTELASVLYKLAFKARNLMILLYNRLLSTNDTIPSCLYYPLLITTHQKTVWPFIKQVIYDMRDHGIVLRPHEYQAIFDHIIPLNPTPEVIKELIKHIHSFGIYLDGDTYINIIQSLYNRNQLIACYELYNNFSQEKHFPISIKLFWIMDNIYKSIGEKYTLLFPLVPGDGLSRIFEFALKANRINYIIKLLDNSDRPAIKNLISAILRSEIPISTNVLSQLKPYFKTIEADYLIDAITSIKTSEQANIALFLYRLCRNKISNPNVVIHLCQLLSESNDYNTAYKILCKFVEKVGNLPRQCHQLLVQLSALVGNIEEALICLNNTVLTPSQYYDLFVVLYEKGYYDKILSLYNTIGENDLRNTPGLNGIALISSIPKGKKQNWTICTDLIKLFETKKYDILLDQYKIFMIKCSELYHFDLCQKLYNHLRSIHNISIISLMECYIDAAIKSKQPSSFIIDNLYEFNIKRSIPVSDLLLSYYLQLSNDPIALFDNIKNNNTIYKGPLSLDVLLSYYLKDDKIDKAEELFNSYSSPLTILNYNKMFEYYNKTKNIDKVKTLVEKMIKNKIQPDSKTFFYINSVLSNDSNIAITINESLLKLMVVS